jgi:hypothetical protein
MPTVLHTQTNQINKMVEELIALHREALIKLEAMKQEMATEKSPQRATAVERLATEYAAIAEKILAASLTA